MFPTNNTHGYTSLEKVNDLFLNTLKNTFMVKENQEIDDKFAIILRNSISG